MNSTTVSEAVEINNELSLRNDETDLEGDNKAQQEAVTTMKIVEIDGMMRVNTCVPPFWSVRGMPTAKKDMPLTTLY